jgi:hypothetical protein
MDEFFAIEVFANAVAFDDDETVADDELGRGVAIAAFEAFTAAANGVPFFADAGIDDLVLDGRAFGTTHGGRENG